MTLPFTANGGTGTAGQFLTSNGATGSPYWSTVTAAAGVNTAAQYTWTNTQTFSGASVHNGNFTVGTATAIRRAVFANGEINFVPYITAESAAANNNYYMNLCDSAGNNGNLMTLNIRGLASAGAAGASLTLVSVTANTFGVSGDIVSAYSDMRLKTKTSKIENALDKVSQLEGFYYIPNQTAIDLGVDHINTKRVGLSAQAVQEVLPEAVKKLPVHEGKYIGKDYLTIQYERVVPLLIEAIKELKEEIRILKETK
jgi:hypothetical protein